MKLRQPPALGTWLLEYLTPGKNNQALAGDLLEDFTRRGSIVWYWRQVFVAILAGYYKELRRRWIGIVFAIGCSSAIPWEEVFLNVRFRSLLLVGLKLAWPVSLFYEVGVVTLLDAVALSAALSIYLGATKSLDPFRFLKGLFVAVLVVSLGNIGLAFLWVAQPPSLFFHVAWRLPLFFGLVLSMWVARPRATHNGSGDMICAALPSLISPKH